MQVQQQFGDRFLACVIGHGLHWWHYFMIYGEAQLLSTRKVNTRACNCVQELCQFNTKGLNCKLVSGNLSGYCFLKCLNAYDLA